MVPYVLIGGPRLKQRVSWGKSLVPEAGLEPARNYIRGILSPLRLPIPPSRHTNFYDLPYVLRQARDERSKNLPLLKRAPTEVKRKLGKSMEAAPGFEPGIGVLQTPALPLGYAAKRYISIFINNKLF